MASTKTTNPILLAMAALAEGQRLDLLMELREKQLPTPQAWLDAGWDALSHLDQDAEPAKWIAQVMQGAWHAAGPVGRCARRSWTRGRVRGAQILWQEAYAQLPGAMT